ncbi:Clavaminate synthase-like protein [Venustampulla echinocandica]|uniref:Clavaminate synthase-like protein n=1 Tax=Venustampulla echinocandica TaxID=2656787 RepID=A0A370U1R3_9HELO|nr:Clavaminate synthase-like protein [Venustampulla echinocandica]RDL41683.1 Clavaminate synthase-like protein [Venustampulla echinocandica]
MATQVLTTTSPHDLPVPQILEPHQFQNLPPFPNDIPTAPLVRLSLKQLRKADSESLRLFESCKNLGFFYLDLRGDVEGEALLKEAGQLFDFAPKFYDLGAEELRKYDRQSQGSYIGYKGFGSNIVDEKGNLDRSEFYNIPKDEFLNISPNPYDHPQLIYDNKPVIVSYILHSHSLVSFILTHLNKHLRLPLETLTKLHALQSPSGDQIRLIKAPPQPPSDQQLSLGKHTDFGSVTLLFNRLGGLQILPPPSIVPDGTEPQWTFVKPLPGHCIVNLGDAMTKFTRGVLRSNIHRVVSPPGEQATQTRYSLVYFSRPNDDVPLKGLDDGGNEGVIPKWEGEGEEDGMNSKDWILLQALRLKSDNNILVEERKKLWEASGRGT